MRKIVDRTVVRISEIISIVPKRIFSSGTKSWTTQPENINGHRGSNSVRFARGRIMSFIYSPVCAETGCNGIKYRTLTAAVRAGQQVHIGFVVIRKVRQLNGNIIKRTDLAKNDTFDIWDLNLRPNRNTSPFQKKFNFPFWR